MHCRRTSLHLALHLSSQAADCNHVYVMVQGNWLSIQMLRSEAPLPLPSLAFVVWSGLYVT